MRVAIVTGESRGLGRSIAETFLKSGIHVVGISRTGCKELTDVAKHNNVEYEHYYGDLSDPLATEEVIDKIGNKLFNEKLSRLYVVNNAAVLPPIDQAMNTSGEDVAYHVQVNTIAPMIIMNTLLKKATEENVRLIGSTITSGAANRPIYGWSAYCSSKASINMYTETVALEQDEQKTRNIVIAFSPGVMDTAMQAQIRASSPEEFIQVNDFIGLKENDLLLETNTVGQILVNILLDEENIENGNIYNVTDFV